MTGFSALDRFLSPDPVDSGCERAMALLHVYAELVEQDPDQARRRYPDVAAHIAQCGPCAEDLTGLLAAIHAMGDDRA